MAVCSPMLAAPRVCTAARPSVVNVWSAAAQSSPPGSCATSAVVVGRARPASPAHAAAETLAALVPEPALLDGCLVDPYEVVFVPYSKDHDVLARPFGFTVSVELLRRSSRTLVSGERRSRLDRCCSRREGQVGAVRLPGRGS